MYKNYKIIKEQELKDINAFGTLMIHEKSGAKVLLLSNEDENKSFCIGFRTPPYDNTGLPHILEHSVLCGSRKFPVKEPFVELMKSSLNTFLNAMTFADKTIYPVASCNDKDFKNLMDVYMDAVLYPNIHSIEEIFKQEGWHYELDSLEGEISYNGVVYNEMKGAFSSPDGVLGRESFNSLFPDTTYGVESGGNPDYIPELTYEKFKEFHKKYYHPSNSYIVIYGNCDMEETLKWIDDEYLSNFEKININSQIEVQKPFENIIEKTVLYPVNAEQGVENKTLMSYNIALQPKTPIKDLFALDIINQVLLQSAGAPLKKALLDEKIGDVIEGQFDSEILQPVFSIVSKNTNVDMKDKFIKMIQNCLLEYSKKGLNQKSLLAAINNYEFKLREADFGGASKGLIYTISCFGTWLYDDCDPFSTFEYSSIFNFFKENIDTNYFEKIIEKYLINNNHKSIVICQPSLDIQSEKEKELKLKLSKYKESLTEEEINKLIEDTKSLKAYQAAPDTKEGLDTIPLLKKEDLSYDVLPLYNIEYNISDIKVLHHNYPTNKIAYIRVLFDVKTIPADLIPYLGFFSKLFGALNTKKHSYESLEQDILINTGGIKSQIFTTSNETQTGVYLSIEVSSLFDKIEYSLDVINEIILTSDFNMKDRIFECLSQFKNYLQQALVHSGHSKALTRALSYTEENYYFNDLVDGIAFFDKLNEILKEYDDKFEDFVLKMNEISKYVFTTNNMILSFTGEEEGFNIFKQSIPMLINGLSKSISNDDLFVYSPIQKNEGFKAPFDVNYVALTGNFMKDNLEYNGSLLVFENAVKTDYLWKNVRVLGGAYGCMCGFGRRGQIFFVSYRDPNLSKTIDVYKGVLNYIDEFNPDEDEMIKFIIGAVGNYDFNKSPSHKVKRALISYLSNITEEDYKKEKAQLINCSIADIKKVSSYIASIIKQNNICVIGNETKIENEKQLFNEVKPLFK